MTLFILKRLAQIIPVTLGVTLVVLNFQETVNELRENLGLNKPLAIQYTDYIKNLLQGDMGHSLKNNQPVFEEITARLPITIELAFYSILITIVLGLIAGIISAIRPYSFMDVGLMIVALLGISLPSFWLGILLMYVFSVQLHWLPVAGWESAKHIILPAVTLGAGGAAIVARMTRSSMLEVVHQDYIRTAKAKGLKGYIIILKHALRNALIPVITVVGLQFGSLLGGTVLVESVFAVNGLGRMIVDAIRTRDIPIVQGGVLVASLIFVFINLFVDILYRIFNKRMDLN